MERVTPGRLAALLVALAALGVVFAVGYTLRAQDPLSSPVMAAEDPYTHMSLTREHLRDGELEAQTPQGALYPPGLHGLLAAWWVYAGGDLYNVMLFGPVVFGLVAIAGVALLVWRWEGALAAFAAALALAAMPEEIHRTTMMSPTALDLALLPFLFFALLEVVRGRLGWLGAALPITAFLVLAHPWILAIANAAGLVFVLLYLAFPWRAARGPPMTREGVACAVAVLGGGLGIALATRWEASGTGFSELTMPITGYNAGLLGAAAVLVAALVAATLFLLPRLTARRLPELNRRPRPTFVQVLSVLGLGLLLAGITLPVVDLDTMTATMPDFVDLPRMLGWPVLVLAVLGLLLVPLAGSPTAHVAASLFLVTYPFVIHNPLDSPYWPHRTVVFLGLACALLAGVAVQRLAEAWRPGAAGAWGRFQRRGQARPRSDAARRGAVGAMAVAAPALLVGMAFAGVVLAETPGPYEGGWYRYYNECEFRNLRSVSDLANQSPKNLVVTGSWQSQLVIGAFTDDSSRIWFKPEYFQPGYDHELFVINRHKEGRPTYVVVDRWLPQEAGPDADWRFLEQSPYALKREDCPSQGAMATRFRLYELQG